jgi:hypothetical protein
MFFVTIIYVATLHDISQAVKILGSILKRRTLTALYNALGYYQTNFKAMKRDIAKWEHYSKKIIRLDEIEELDQIHNGAVFDC